MPKTRLNLSLDKDLVNFIKVYVQENRTTVSNVFTQFLLSLKRRSSEEDKGIIISDPNFHAALIDIQTRLREGSTEWCTFEEVFGE